MIAKRFSDTRNKRIATLLAVLLFFTQSVSALHALIPNGVDGFLTTLCTAQGVKTVLVTIDEDGQQTPSGFTCPLCVLQANLVSLPIGDAALPGIHFQLTGLLQPGPTQTWPDSGPFPFFQSRAPPA